MRVLAVCHYGCKQTYALALLLLPATLEKRTFILYASILIASSILPSAHSTSSASLIEAETLKAVLLFGIIIAYLIDFVFFFPTG